MKCRQSVLSRQSCLCTSSSLASARFARSFHSSTRAQFPLSDFNVFWLRQPRKWDFIEFGNHPEMYPLQRVNKLGVRKLYGSYIPQNEKQRPQSHDTFNANWQVLPWAHNRPDIKVPCVLHTEEEQIDFELPRYLAERIKHNLRNRCSIYDLTVIKPQALSLTPHQLIAASWKDFNNNNNNYNNNNNVEMDAMNAMNEEMDGKIDDMEAQYNMNEINGLNGVNGFWHNGLTTRTTEGYLCFLKDIKTRFIFEDVEELIFEKWEPNQPRNIVIPIRFYGLNQWFRTMHDSTTWNTPTRLDRPRYVQHAWEVEFRWDGKHKIPSHLSVTVEQFCLPWKTEITLNDIKLPDWLIPMKNPNDIKILSLDFSRASRKSDNVQEDGSPKKQDLSKLRTKKASSFGKLVI